MPRDDSLEIVRALRGRVKQYVVSNGTVVAQNKKLKLSGLGELMDGIFLSEELGVEKPNVEFFEKVVDAIGTVDPVGTLTCWYNPTGQKAPEDLRIDYEITDLHQVFDLL